MKTKGKVETGSGPTCPVCDEPLGQRPTRSEQAAGAMHCQCRQCGDFEYMEGALQGERFNEARHLVSAWIRRQIKAGVVNPIVPPPFEPANEWFESLKYSGVPSTVSEKLDALLRYYGGFPVGKTIDCANSPDILAEIAATGWGELYALNHLLRELNSVSLGDSAGNSVELTADGWRRVEEIDKKGSQSDSAFVAMWFHPRTEQYRAATVRALETCGYKALIVDETEFNDFIMDQVLALIRQSRFVIADFTCQPERVEEGKVKQGVRGGVYWEAGLAYGMGRQVIHTCEDSDESRGRIHFDVAQYRTLFWRPEELTLTIRPLDSSIPNPSFAERLAQRILGTIGKGTYSR